MACENYPRYSFSVYMPYRPVSHLFYITFELSLCRVCLFNSLCRLYRDYPVPGELLRHLSRDLIRRIDRKERVDVTHISRAQSVHVQPRHIRIPGHYGAVEAVVGIPVLSRFLLYAGIKDEFHSPDDQLLEVAVRQFCRKAERLRRYSVNSQALVRTRRGKFHPEPQLGEECEPERIIFVDVQHPRDPQGSPRGVFRTEGNIVFKEPFVLRGIEVRRKLPRRSPLGLSVGAHISCNVPPSSAEGSNCQQAAVAAPLTAFRLCFRSEHHELLPCDYRAVAGAFAVL